MNNAGPSNSGMMTMSSISPSYSAIPGSTLRGREGHSCFGFCCDMRRAVIIVNAVSVVLTIVLVSLFTAGYDLIENAALDPGADEETKADAAFLKQLPIGFLIFFSLIKITCSSIGILGALHYTEWMVIVAAATHVLRFVYDTFTFNIIGMIIAGCFIYPHYVFIQEMRKGIMTPENYPNEVQSCCCV